MEYVTPYFSPNRGGASLICGYIDRCTTTLDIAVYSITHDAIAEAIIRAHARGVRVRVLMDDLQAKNRYADDETLMAAGIPVRVDSSSGAMHHKFAIDGTRAVATGSFNWTKSADTRNAENFLIVRLKKVVTQFQEEFESLWEKNAPSA